MDEKTVRSPAQAKAPQAAATGSAPPITHFPAELRRHFFASADWTSIIFIGVSLAVNLLVVGIVASRDWKDPAAELTNEQLLKLQDVITKRFVEVEVPPPPTEMELPDISNPEFEKALREQQASLEASLQSTLADAQRTLDQLDRQLSEQTGGTEAAAAGDLANLLSDLGDLGSLGEMSAADLGGPALDIAPTDVAIFAEGATGSRVVSGAIDIRSLGSNVQISSQFTKGGLSSAEAARLSQQIQFARERLGSNIQLRVSTGLGAGRRAALRVASAGKTGKRIQVDQLALPPARAAGPGGRDQDAVEAQAARTRTLIGGCYMIGLAADPSLSGLVVVRFTINPDGSVTNVQVSNSNLGNREVEACVVAAVQTWKFTPGSTTDTFEYPFTFEPG